ncbi:MAG TPA: cation transporter [Pseudomonas sp.]|jgi:Co/Zn/Cd efflux system component|uniref:cation transporter n=1 Tax=Pseudomonas sp. TaxID=306 RepID=UPI002C912F66|nr:cation transporter [Pseudomonas sp.]HTO19745.1 cation transporter [Pseudomonas sp.]
MGANCCSHEDTCATALRSGRYRKILWIALVVNFTMFVVEIGAGFTAGSVSLLADSLDFAGDAANYGISLLVLGMGVVARARASLFKALCMLLFGIAVLATALWHLVSGTVPSAPTMGVVGTLALLANVGVAALLYAYREGDSNMRSVWLCSRNDALGNLAVLLAALGVFGTGSAWPDLLVAGIMASLATSAATQILLQARGELKGEQGLAGQRH